MVWGIKNYYLSTLMLCGKRPAEMNVSMPSATPCQNVKAGLQSVASMAL